MPSVFFAKFQEETRRVDCGENITTLDEIYGLVREKFDNKAGLSADLELSANDPEYNTPYTIANISDIQNGTVITIKIKKVVAAEKRKLESDGNVAPVKKFKPAGEPRFVVRCRGLPWECTKQQLLEFFEGSKVIEQKILYLPNGRSTGEAIVELETQEDYDAAIGKNRGYMGRRYIEIFKSTDEDMDRAMGVNHQEEGSTGPVNANNQVVRLRGLPYSALKTDILEFFSPGLSPAGGESGVHIVRDKDIGRPSGIAYVEFETDDEVNTALGMNRKHMGTRYVEVFGSNQGELARAMGQSSAIGGQTYGEPGDIGGMGAGTTTCLHLRGLPFECSEVEITKFFQEAGVTPVRIHRKADGAEAYVEFASPSDTDRAMSRNRCYIKHRYIELFRVSYAEVARTVGLGGNGPPCPVPDFPPPGYQGGYQGGGPSWGGMPPSAMFGEPPRPYY